MSTPENCIVVGFLQFFCPLRTMNYPYLCHDASKFTVQFVISGITDGSNELYLIFSAENFIDLSRKLNEILKLGFRHIMKRKSMIQQKRRKSSQLVEVE